MAAAYAMLSKADPLAAAAAVVAGYHGANPLSEEELAVVFPFAAIRLCVSVCLSAHRRTAEPENPYLMVTESPAWEALRMLRDIPPRLPEYVFREACGLPPCPQAPAVAAWLSRNRGGDRPGRRRRPFAGDRVRPFRRQPGDRKPRGGGRHAGVDVEDRRQDAGGRGARGDRALRRGAPRLPERRLPVLLGREPGVANGASGGRCLRAARLRGLRAAARARPQLPRQRGAPGLRADGDPGARGRWRRPRSSRSTATCPPTRSPGSLPGMPVAKGQTIGRVGQPPGNGDWPPHLHFQIVTDLLGQGRRLSRGGAGEPARRLAVALTGSEPDARCFGPPGRRRSAGAALRAAPAPRALALDLLPRAAPDRSGARRVPLRRDGPRLSGRREQRGPRRPLPPARRARRAAPDGRVEHEHALPARVDPALRRAACGPSFRSRSRSASSSAREARPTSWRCASPGRTRRAGT